MVGLTISMYFQSLKTSNFYFCPGEHATGPPKTLAECPTVPNLADCPDFT